MKICNKCNKEKNINEFRIVGNYRRNTCKKCEADETKIQAQITTDYIKSKKTKCIICGYNKSKSALDFHHTNSEDKEFTISKYKRLRWSNEVKVMLDKEIEKCIVVCKNCHCEIHDEIIII